jgi:hypothetical protein
VLERLRMVTEDPRPAGRSDCGKRYRGTHPDRLGAIVWGRSKWREIEVQAILATAIDAELATLEERQPSLLAGP